MGFFDFVKDVLENMNEQLKQKKEEIDKKVSVFRNRTDTELLKLYVKGSFVERAAAAKILKERGYNPQQLLENIKMLRELKQSAEELERLSREFDKLSNH